MNVLHALSTVVIILIALGIWQRKRTKVHYSMMLSAFALDLGMVLYIELTRKAINTAISIPGPLLMFHIVISTLVLVLYGVQIYLGWQLYRGKAPSKRAHRIAGILFCTFRLTNYVTSFLIPTSH